MTRRVARALLVVATLSGRAEAVQTMGAGVGISCGTWLEDRRTRGGHFSALNWALGYLSGAAIFGDVGDPLRGVDPNGVAYWLDNWCRANPSSYFSDGVRAFINAQRPR
jgi:hypothetical protein